MALRVLLTHERFPPNYGGGGEYIALRTATGLMARGHDVRVLTTGDPADTHHEGVPTQRLPVSRYAFNLQLRAIAAAARNADIVQTFNYHACLPTLLAAHHVGKPVVGEMLALFGSAWRDMRGPILGRAFEAWERFLVTRRYDRTIYFSDASYQAGLRMGAPKEGVVIMPPGLDHAVLPQPDRRAPLVLFAGRMDVRKGIHHVVAAARALPEIPFAAVGWGPDLAGLRAQAPANLEIVESHDKSAYLPLLARAQVFFFPSYSETYGLVVAEAMACASAVVSSIDTIKFAGQFVAPGDEAAMIAAVRRLWHDKAQAAADGAENLRRAQGFTWDVHIDHLLSIYDDVLAGRPSPLHFSQAQ